MYLIDPHLPLPLNQLDEMLVGTSRTRSASSLVTDSAAGATAFACGQKTYNGGIGGSIAVLALTRRSRIQLSMNVPLFCTSQRFGLPLWHNP